MPSLSICIPTYNFGGFIGETLHSIVRENPSDLEIVILDGGSTDNTTEVVRTFAAQHPYVHYHRQDHRGGIDRDMARVVDLASGDYCWLFSADDLLIPGAIREVQRRLAAGMDILLGGFTLATLDMRPRGNHPVLASTIEAKFDLAERADRLRYFAMAQTTVPFFSFCGSLVIRRARWMSRALDDNFVGSCWAHVARLFSLIPDGLRVHYIPRSLLLKRSDNDSFMDRGIVNRVAIAIDGYHHLADTFFGRESAEAFHIRRVLRNEFGPYSLLYVRSTAVARGEVGELARLDSLVRKLHGDPGWNIATRNLIYRATPLPVYRGLRWSFRSLRSLAGRVRSVS